MINIFEMLWESMRSSAQVLHHPNYFPNWRQKLIEIFRKTAKKYEKWPIVIILYQQWYNVNRSILNYCFHAPFFQHNEWYGSLSRLTLPWDILRAIFGIWLIRTRLQCLQLRTRVPRLYETNHLQMIESSLGIPP